MCSFKIVKQSAVKKSSASAKIIHLPRAWESPMFRAYPAPFPSLVNRISVFFCRFPENEKIDRFGVAVVINDNDLNFIPSGN